MRRCADESAHDDHTHSAWETTFHMRRLRTSAATLCLLLVVGACAQDPDPQRTTPVTNPTTATTLDTPNTTRVAAPTTMRAVSPQVAVTSGDPSGNRVIPGIANLADPPLIVTLGRPAKWVVGAPVGGDVVWVVADDEGVVEAYLDSGGSVTAFEVAAPQLPPGAPPTVLVVEGTVAVFDPHADRPGLAALAGHILVGETPVTIGDTGDVSASDVRIPGVVALHDSRIVVGRNGLAAMMTDPTERLNHAVIGDGVEAETVTVIDPGAGEVVAVLDAPDNTVFEAISPLWADVDGDGAEEILVTASDGDAGARLVVYRTDGSILAQSPAIGRGNRWLNQLGVAPLGPGGEIEVVEVRTPHIGGVVGWYRLEGDQLVRQNTASEYSTHGIFSRNLDEGLIVDANGDGRPDVVVPTQDDTRLVALSRTADGSEIVGVVDLPARPSSNLAGVSRPDGTASLALATEDGQMLLWR